MHYGDTYLSAITLNTVKLKTNDKTKIINVTILFLLKVIKNIHSITIVLLFGKK